MVGLPHKMDMKPLDLSAGEQQRIAIARALINQPAIVLADEPTGNLDSVNSRLILDLFRELNQRLGQTIMMITHNPEAAAVAHRTIEMKDGRVLSHGHPAPARRRGRGREAASRRWPGSCSGTTRAGSLPYDLLVPAPRALHPPRPRRPGWGDPMVVGR